MYNQKEWSLGLRDFQWMNHSASSWAWKSLLYGRDLIFKGICWQVGNGQSIRIYEDKWIPGIHVPLSNLIPFAGSSDTRVSELINLVHNRPAGMSLVLHLFPISISQRILAIPLPHPFKQDDLLWPFTKTSAYSTPIWLPFSFELS